LTLKSHDFREKQKLAVKNPYILLARPEKEVQMNAMKDRKTPNGTVAIAENKDSPFAVSPEKRDWLTQDALRVPKYKLGPVQQHIAA
jgi:hypothetical protein